MVDIGFNKNRRWTSEFR